MNKMNFQFLSHFHSPNNFFKFINNDQEMNSSLGK